LAQKLILVVIDGLRADTFEEAVTPERTPWLARLAEAGEYRRAISTFPSLTPVCLSSIATGAHPDVHHIPHLVWYSREEQRLVEYGSSFGAIRRAGITQSLRDSMVEMNARHLSRDAATIFETLEDAGLTTACVNFTCYRGRTRYRPSVPGIVAAVSGPKQFYFYSVYQSQDTGAPLAWRNRSAGTIDAYATAVGRWLVTRDGFDFFVYYLSDYDYASHLHGPGGDALDALERCDRGIGTLVEAAGGFDLFLERYGVLVCADHGQTPVREAVALEPLFSERELLVTASNRAGMVYRLGEDMPDPETLARRLDGVAAVEVALWRDGDEAVARRDGAELRFSPGAEGFVTHGDAAILDHPDALVRAWAALANPNAGELLLSAAEGVEFADLAGGSHAGGGSHGSLVTGDSEVPVLSVNAGPPPGSITGIAPLVAQSFGVDPPSYVHGEPARVA
jgi:predicted AlkP superfamily pyrophosphatase or phosphodiesterase